MKKLVYISLLLAGLSLHSMAQVRFPDDGIVFSGNSVARVDIDIDPDSLDVILQPGNEQSNHEFPAVFTFTRGAYSETIDSVGFRIRGNTSRYSAKKSFKVSFNTFIRGQKFAGIEKMNLNGEHNDPSIARARTCWHLFRRAGVPASRAGHTELYINGEYKGLYLNVEHIDEEFAGLRFGNNGGDMYKCLWPADLTYLGEDPELYKFEHEGRRAYELKRNETSDDYSALADLIGVLNLTDPEDYPEALERVFNVNIYLKNLVVEILAGHWDAYSYNKNNYYLYLNEATDKFEFIPYDPDNTLGISWWDIDWTSEYIYSWYPADQERPLTKKLLQNSTYKDRFSFYMDRYLTQFFNSTYLDPFTTDIRTQIAPYAEDDLYRTYDYGYTMDDFRQAYTGAQGAHVRHGIQPFISQRHSTATGQLQLNEISPIITWLNRNSPTYYENLVIHALVEDEQEPEEVILYYSEGDGYTGIAMAAEGGDVYVGSIPGLSGPGTISFYMEAKDVNQQVSRDPVSGTYSYSYGMVGIGDKSSDGRARMEVYRPAGSPQLQIRMPGPPGSYSFRLIALCGATAVQGRGYAVGSQDRITLGSQLPPGIYILEVSTASGESFREKVMLTPEPSTR